MLKGQTKFMSWVETIINVVIGYTINVIAQAFIFPLFNIQISIYQDMLIGALFTAISIVRSFTLRRFFNWVYCKWKV